MQEKEKNYEKQEIYAHMKANLQKAMKAGFYYEAVFIEYAIIEDRCTSLLMHGNLQCTDKNNRPYSLDKKLNVLESNKIFNDKRIRKNLSIELINELRLWKTDRNKLIHALARTKYDSESLREFAQRGQALANILDNKVKSINRYLSDTK